MMPDVHSPPVPERQRLASLQVFRALAAIWVLLCHVYIIAEMDYGVPFENRFLIAGGEAALFFFVLSGFIIAYVHWEHLGAPGNVRPYLARRLSRIYPPVFILVTLKILYMLFSGGGEGRMVLSAKSVTASYLLLPSRFYVIAVLWTLVFEMTFYVLFAVAVALGKRVAVAGSVVWAALVLGRYLLGYPDEHETIVSTVTHPLCLLFLMGALSARIFMNQKWMNVLGWLWIPGLAVLSICVWSPKTGFMTEASRGFLMYILWGVASALIILSAVHSERKGVFRWPAWLQALGDASYSIYLVHTSVMMVLVVILKRTGLPVQSWLFGTLVVIGLVSFVASVLFWKWVERPLMSWWNRRITPVLSGGRKLQTVNKNPVNAQPPVVP